MKDSSLLLLAMMICCARPFSRAFNHVTTRARFASLSSTVTPESVSIDSFNPLGPPAQLAALATGESLGAITRLSRSPDLFHIKGFLSKTERDTLIEAAAAQGMSVAGTRNSEANSIRKDSFLTWIDPYDFSGRTSSEALSVARDLINKSAVLFAHESMRKMMLEGGRVDYFFAEDLQVAKYDTGGCFSFHHDGYSRYLTTLTYLDGVAGTWFPFANSREIDATDETSAVEIAMSKRVGRDGILVVGEEGVESYVQSSDVDSSTIFQIEAGDAIIFYSYKYNGEKDWRSLHCSLPVPQEKWISTCWFRSEALTGPFSYLKLEAMRDQV